VPIFTTGKFPDGRPIPDQGHSPMKTGFGDGPDGKKFAGKPTDYQAMIPTLDQFFHQSVAVWATMMDEDRYLTRRFISARSAMIFRSDETKSVYRRPEGKY
jgi:hypothetical protein